MTWELIATGMGTLVSVLLGIQLHKVGKLQDKIEGMPDKMIITFDRICHERQQACSKLVCKDVEKNAMTIEAIQRDRKEIWEKHLDTLHPRPKRYQVRGDDDPCYTK